MGNSCQNFLGMQIIAFKSYTTAITNVFSILNMADMNLYAIISKKKLEQTENEPSYREIEMKIHQRP